MATETLLRTLLPAIVPEVMIARGLALKAVKSQMRAMELRPEYAEAGEIMRRLQTYFREHQDELLSEARALLMMEMLSDG
jgi:hypothetical protein